MQANIGLIGMAVMGSNLALNLASRGFAVAVYNLEPELTRAVIEANPEARLQPHFSLEDLVASLERPRKILMMIRAGEAVDLVSEALLPLLEAGDILIDGGNSYYKDTQRRFERLAGEGLHFVGLGVSGGETGARFGPALMPGCEPKAYEALRPFLDAIAARAADGTPCSAWLGTGGAGHYVKMVHNGIEYADMQLIAEAYALLKALGGFSNEELAAIFARWNEGPLASYLIEITAKILRERDPHGGGHLLDCILDVARQKGTGKWTNIEAVDLGVDASVLLAGLNARVMSMKKAEREAAARRFPEPQGELLAGREREGFVAAIEGALLAAKVIAYAQGFALYRAANEAYDWGLVYERIAASFRAGCIIRSDLLEPMMRAFSADRALPNLMMAPYFSELLEERLPALRRCCALGIAAGLPLAAHLAALSYFDAYRRAESSANLIQAQRDFFGAHSFERRDCEGVFHHRWTE